MIFFLLFSASSDVLNSLVLCVKRFEYFTNFASSTLLFYHKNLLISLSLVTNPMD